MDVGESSDQNLVSRGLCASTTAESRAKIGTSKMHLSPPVALAAVRSKVVVLLLLIGC